MQKELSIIIVNTNSVDYLKKCIPTVFSGEIRDSFEVVVVDNASYDGAKEFLEENYPEVIFVQSDANLGFTRGNNVGYSHSRGRVLLFLNGDTEVIGPAIQLMLDALKNNPKAGIAGPMLLNADGSLQAACVQSFPTVTNYLLEYEPLREIFPHSRLWGIRALLQKNNGPVRVEMVSGACLMIRRDVFEKLGCFDTDYFIYSEDVDLCYRTMKLGLDVVYVDAAKVLHYGGGSTTKKGQSEFSTILSRESLLGFMKKHYGWPYPFLLKATSFANAAVRLLILKLLQALKLGKGIDAAGSSQKWEWIMRWSLGFEKWATELNSPCRETPKDNAKWNYVRNMRRKRKNTA